MRREHRRRLVEHEHAMTALPALDRAHDRDDHALDRSRLRERAVEIDLDAETGEQLARDALLLGPADAPQAAAHVGAAQREVVHDPELENVTKVLMDEAQPVMAFELTADRELLVLEPGLGAGVRVVIAGERLDQ